MCVCFGLIFQKAAVVAVTFYQIFSTFFLESLFPTSTEKKNNGLPKL